MLSNVKESTIYQKENPVYLTFWALSHTPRPFFNKEWHISATGSAVSVIP